MQRKFAIVFDNFDKTTVNKNVGLFAQYLASRGIAVEIITNKTKDNSEQLFNDPNITVRRLQTKKEWEPLDHPGFYQFLEENIDTYFAIWIYRGRKYAGQVAALAYQKNILIIVKLDSDATVSKLGSVILKPISRSVRAYTLQLKLFKLLQRIPNIPLLSGYFFYDLPLLLSAFVLCESPESLKSLQKYLPSEKLILYPNSIPLHRLNRVKSRQKKNIMLTVGRIVPQKNFEKGIEAYAGLPANIRKKWHYEIIGPVHDKDYYNKLKKLIAGRGLEKEITIIPGLYGDALYKKYAESSILLMPYPRPAGTKGFEGQPNVIVDAMFFKNVVVATDVGSVTFLLDSGKAGLLVEDDTAQISKTLLSIVNNTQKRNTLGISAKLRVEQYFNLEKNAGNFVETLLAYDYRQYFSDQKYDTIVGDEIKTLLYKYCDLLTEKILPKFNYSHARILDIGCREFFTYDYFLENYKNKIKGIDIGDAGLTYAKEKGVVELDIHKMDTHFKKNSLDIILSIHVFEHMYDLPEVLRKCQTVLRKGGYLFFAFPMPVKSTRRGHWVTMNSEKEMLEICKQAGLKKIFSTISPAGILRDEQEMIGLVQKV